jgi:hypothetical protein
MPYSKCINECRALAKDRYLFINFLFMYTFEIPLFFQGDTLGTKGIKRKTKMHWPKIDIHLLIFYLSFFFKSHFFFKVIHWVPRGEKEKPK